MDKNTVLITLNKKWSKKELSLENWNKLDDIKIAKLFSFFDYSKPLVIDHCHKNLKKNRDTTTKAINRFMKNCKESDIDLEHFSREKIEANKLNARNTKKKDGIQKAFEKMQPILDLFNINKQSTINAIRGLADNPDLSHEAILRSYKELYILLMAKAKGETVTRITNVTYVVSVDENGNTVKEIAKNSNNQQKIYETTQSHLPDEKAFAGALLVMEVIERLENGNKVFATDEELEEEYSLMLATVRQQRETYGNKEYSQEEIDAVEAEIEE
ncbi:MAG: hypothetical protein ACWGHH_06500 [Sulfurovaceae bacterium]